jgi:hypothetical protein
MRRNQLAAAKALLMATVGIFQFLIYSGSGNVVYIMMLDPPKLSEK